MTDHEVRSIIVQVMAFVLLLTVATLGLVYSNLLAQWVGLAGCILTMCLVLSGELNLKNWSSRR
jgi:hypothetical protein